jgi:ABC-type bacteriocin/lantibiotic exporter with double-glycine peptidase domain
MAPYLARHGFEAFAFRGDWVDLEHHLAAGRPLVVAFEPGRGRMHYAVAAGIGADAIALNDPADRKLRQYSRRDFERRWESTGRWTLLAVPAPR